ncbi:MAG: hypothetical protein L0387_43625 [Acidobacteria bacterium]|nr:hypothetical protein [Acidobacteriota bacterium]MCI0720677.1 hypothetical protein [Acidobacteriota bacterium]
MHKKKQAHRGTERLAPFLGASAAVNVGASVDLDQSFPGRIKVRRAFDAPPAADWRVEKRNPAYRDIKGEALG